MIKTATSTPNLNAAKMIRGVNPQNRVESVQHVAEVAATDVSVLGSSLETQLMGDVSKLRQQLSVRGLTQSQMATALMTAGALLGVNGFSIQDLAGGLSETVRDPSKLDEMAGKIQHFSDGASTLQGDQYQSFGLNVQSALIQQGDLGPKKGPESSRVPTALFIAGAHLAYEQDQGGIFRD